MDFEYTYILTETAEARFIQIYDYIADNLSNETAAKDLTDKFLAAIKNACIFPTMHPKYKNYRKITIGKFLIFYKISKARKQIIITNALYGAMDYDKYL